MNRNSTIGQYPQQPGARGAAPDQAGAAISAFSVSVLAAPESAESVLASANDLFAAGVDAPSDSVSSPTQMSSASLRTDPSRTDSPNSLAQQDLSPNVSDPNSLSRPQAASLTGYMPPESAADYQDSARQQRRRRP